MKIENTTLEGKEASITDMDIAMEEAGFLRWSWDYKRATYDYKFQDQKTGHVMYLRVPTVATEGFIEDGRGEAHLKVHVPYLGKHIYPHGLDYDYDFPPNVLDKAKKKIEEVSSYLV